MSECKYWVIMFNDHPEVIFWGGEAQARDACERIRDQYIKENFIDDLQSRRLFVRPVEVSVVAKPEES